MYSTNITATASSVPPAPEPPRPSSVTRSVTNARRGAVSASTRSPGIPSRARRIASDSRRTTSRRRVTSATLDALRPA